MFKDRIVKSVDLIQNFIGMSSRPYLRFPLLLLLLLNLIYRHWRATEIRRGGDV